MLPGLRLASLFFLDFVPFIFIGSFIILEENGESRNTQNEVVTQKALTVKWYPLSQCLLYCSICDLCFFHDFY